MKKYSVITPTALLSCQIHNHLLCCINTVLRKHCPILKMNCLLTTKPIWNRSKWHDIEFEETFWCAQSSTVSIFWFHNLHQPIPAGQIQSCKPFGMSRVSSILGNGKHLYERHHSVIDTKMICSTFFQTKTIGDAHELLEREMIFFKHLTNQFCDAWWTGSASPELITLSLRMGNLHFSPLVQAFSSACQWGSHCVNSSCTSSCICSNPK